MKINLPAPQKPHVWPLGTVEVFGTQSESRPSKIHYTLRWPNGHYECSCDGWQNNDKCWHVTELKENEHETRD